MLNITAIGALSIFKVDPETLTQMWQTVVLGMGMIFAVLALLWVILAIFGVAFGGKKPQKSAPAKAQTTASAPKAESTPAPAPAKVQQSNDAELVAIITAAVAAYMESEQGIQVPDGSFRVVSFKRVRDGRAWNAR